MPLILSEEKSISVSIKSLIIDQFSVRPNDSRAKVNYHFRDSANVVVTHGSLDITDNNFNDLVVRINDLLGAMTDPDAYSAIKQALYERIMAAEGLTGDIE